MLRKEYKDFTEIIDLIEDEIRHIDPYMVSCGDAKRQGLYKAIDIINDYPIADAREVVHGMWETIIDPHGQIEGWIHKECGRQVTSKDEYCPKCGAKMDKESPGKALDEAIENLNSLIKEDNFNCEECKEEHIQLLNWLLELRVFKFKEHGDKL